MRFWLYTRRTLAVFGSFSERTVSSSSWVSVWDGAKVDLAGRQGRRVLQTLRQAGWCQPPKWVSSPGRARKLRWVERHRGRRRCRKGRAECVSWALGSSAGCETVSWDVGRRRAPVWSLSAPVDRWPVHTPGEKIQERCLPSCLNIPGVRLYFYVCLVCMLDLWDSGRIHRWTGELPSAILY